MKEQRTKQILICLAASLGCFWLGNRVGLLYVSAAGTVTQRLAAAVNLSKIVLHPLQLSPAPIPVGCGVGAILLAGLVYLCIKYSGHRLVPQKEYGSARWGTAADIAPFLHEKASENIPLTATESLSLAMKMPVTAENNYNRNKNVIVFGPSGSGKSYSVAGPQLLQFNSNYVLSDPKGELLDTYGNVLVSQGYDVKVFNLKDRDKSDHYNPFAYIHDTDDIVVVAKNLIKNMKEDPRQKNTADPIWEEGSTSLLEALLAYVYFEQPPEMHNMNSVMELFVLMQHRYGPQGRSQLDDIFEDLAMEKPASFAARQYGLYHMAPDKTAQSIDVSLGMRMSAFNIPSIMKICEDDTIHLEELASDKKVALFVVTPDTTTAYNFLAAVIKCRSVGSALTADELQALLAGLNIDPDTARGQVVAFAISCQGHFVYGQPSSLRGGPGNASVGMNLDCSSFVQYCYWAQGLPFAAGNTAAYGRTGDLRAISPAEVQPGDLRVVYAAGGEQGHVQMTLGGGAWIECCYGYGVCVNMSNAWMESRGCHYFTYAGF